MKKLLILSCGRRKRPNKGIIRAIDRYDGGWHRVVRKRVFSDDRIDDIDVVILSGRYGLISADYLIPYYEEQEPHRRLREKREEIHRSLRKLIETENYGEIYLLMGSEFKGVVDGAIPKSVDVVFCNGGYGEKMSHFIEWLHR